MIKIGNKKALHSRSSAIVILTFLALFSVIIVSDLKFNYLNLTGFAVNILLPNFVFINIYNLYIVGVTE